jgi:hypothetical protein
MTAERSVHASRACRHRFRKNSGFSHPSFARKKARSGASNESPRAISIVPQKEMNFFAEMSASTSRVSNPTRNPIPAGRST